MEDALATESFAALFLSEDYSQRSMRLIVNLYQKLPIILSKSNVIFKELFLNLLFFS